MARYNVQYNRKWACFSSIPDLFVTNFMSKLDYESWRMEEYGKDYSPLRYCNKMTMKEAVFAASLNHSKEEVIENFVEEAGLDKAEAEALYEKYKVKPEEIAPCEDEDEDGSTNGVFPQGTKVIFQTTEKDAYTEKVERILHEKFSDDFIITRTGEISWEIKPIVKYPQLVVTINIA
jgi:2-hydroxychromene-2-carboxylate isomerase